MGGVPSRLISTANHFYQEVEGEWLCLEFSRTDLRNCGIYVRDEQALPVGDTPVSEDWIKQGWVCPHIVGGIPPSVVKKTYKMIRDGGKFLSIEGLGDN